MNKDILALYVRISEEDDEAGLDESNSISSQREILLNYIKTCDDLEEYKVVEFCDNGFSGANFNRPGVQSLLKQIKQGLISCVLVKDLSRFGRNYIEVGTYLEQVFPFLGVRFISVNDCFDSKSSSCFDEFLGVSFKNLIYDLYSKDLSEKVTSVRKAKAEQGKFITAYAPYGFLKSSEQRLIADEETAPVVQRIFQMAARGVPKAHIAKTLNAEGIPSPLMTRKMRGQHFPCKVVNEKSFWKTVAVSAILKDQRYTGDAIYGKVKPTAVGSGKDCAVPKEKWIIVPNSHEAIVSRELFDTVNAMFTKRSHYSERKIVPLTGMVRCGVCNHVISRRKRISAKIGETTTYRCNTLNMLPEAECCSITLKEYEIERAILMLLQKASATIMNLETVETAQENHMKKIEQAEELLNQYTLEIHKLSGKRMKEYEAYKDGRLSKEDFIGIKEKIDKKVEDLSSKSELKRQELYLLRCKSDSVSDSTSMVRKFRPFEALTREIVETFIQQIYICQDGTLRIEWKFEDFFRLLK